MAAGIEPVNGSRTCIQQLSQIPKSVRKKWRFGMKAAG
jgi:hypothetical protein